MQRVTVWVSVVLQVIVRLKKEIQLLREELAMLTGEQREGQLAEDEIQKYGA